MFWVDGVNESIELNKDVDFLISNLSPPNKYLKNLIIRNKTIASNKQIWSTDFKTFSMSIL